MDFEALSHELSGQTLLLREFLDSPEGCQFRKRKLTNKVTVLENEMKERLNKIQEEYNVQINPLKQQMATLETVSRSIEVDEPAKNQIATPIVAPKPAIGKIEQKDDDSTMSTESLQARKKAKRQEAKDVKPKRRIKKTEKAKDQLKSITKPMTITQSKEVFRPKTACKTPEKSYLTYKRILMIRRDSVQKWLKSCKNQGFYCKEYSPEGIELQKLYESFKKFSTVSVPFLSFSRNLSLLNVVKSRSKVSLKNGHEKGQGDIAWIQLVALDKLHF